MKKNILNVKKGDTIFVLDCSFIHEVGTKYNEGMKPMTSEQIHLMCDAKGKKAIVEKEPYEDTIIFLDKEETHVFIDVYVKDVDKHVSVVADYISAQSKSKEEFDFKMKMAQYESYIMDEYYEYYESPYFE